MKKISKIIISLFLIMSLTACNFSDSEFYKRFFSDEKKAQTNEELQVAPIENEITIGVVELDNYNPLYVESPTAKYVLSFLYEPLFSINPDMTTEGILAHSYNLSPDGKSIRVNLKEGVIWHNGDMFTSRDVVYTVNEIKNNNTRYSSMLEGIRGVASSGDFAVDISFNRALPNPVLLLSFPIVKYNTGSGIGTKPIGTGPFFFDYDKLSAFESYHSGRANIDRIKVMSIPDNEKFLSLFNASVIDLADSDMLDMTEYMPKNNSVVYNYTSNKMVFVGFNANDAVFRFPEARRSVSELINRKYIAGNIYFSRAEAARYPLNPESRFYPQTTTGVRGDTSSAEKVLTDKGWKTDKRGIYYYSDKVSITYFSVNILVNSDSPERVKIAEEISKTMNSVGMPNTVTKCSDSEFISRISSGNYDMFIGETELLPNNDLTYMASSGSNKFGYSSPETDTLITQLGMLSAENDIKAVWENLCLKIDEDCPFAPICFLKDSLVTSAKIKNGVEPSFENSVRFTKEWSLK